jgi:nicotinate-nucleotide adenylyltransferase
MNVGRTLAARPLSGCICEAFRSELTMLSPRPRTPDRILFVAETKTPVVVPLHRSALHSFASLTARPPLANPGQRIGLMGGSFNPAHEGHAIGARTAMRRLRLDAVWWMVTPANPLKPSAGLPSLAQRTESARTFAKGRAMPVTGFEAALGSPYTVATLLYLKQRFPRVRFVWIMGADNLATFHHWRHWREMTCLVPIAVVDRPGWRLKALASPAARWMAGRRLPEEAASLLPNRKPPAWAFLSTRLSEQSSTALRARLGP